mgnify:CR=1 FL=1
MAEIEKGIKESDRLAASERLLAILKEGEDSAEEKGWITADEVKVKLEHNRRKAFYTLVRFLCYMFDCLNNCL